MGLHKTRCFVLIYKLVQGGIARFHPAWYRPDPLPGDPPNAWRFILGGAHKEGYLTLEQCQIQARILGKNIDGMKTDSLGQLECPEENVVLKRVLWVTLPFEIMVLPPWGPGTSNTLADVLDKTQERRVILAN